MNLELKEIMEKYIQLLANSYFWAYTIVIILGVISSFSPFIEKYRELNYETKAKKGKLYSISIPSLIFFVLYILSIKLM